MSIIYAKWKSRVIKHIIEVKATVRESSGSGSHQNQFEEMKSCE